MKLDDILKNLKNDIEEHYDTERLKFNNDYENSKMEIDELYKKSNVVSSSGRRSSHSVRFSDILYMKMNKLAKDNDLKIAEIYDMALFMFINAYEKIDMSEYPELQKKVKNKKKEGYPKLCLDCEALYNTSEHDSCPKCS